MASQSRSSQTVLAATISYTDKAQAVHNKTTIVAVCLHTKQRVAALLYRAQPDDRADRRGGTMEYTVKKSKAGRIGYRITGAVFLVLGILGVLLAVQVPSMKFLVIAVAAVAAFYGVYLLKASFRQQAYDITYEFTEEHIKLILHNGEKLLPYDEVSRVQWIEPSPDVDYVMIQIRSGKQQYVLHFTGKRAYAEKIYSYLLARVPEIG